MISETHSLFDEDRRLRAGRLVSIHWSKAGFNYRGRGRVVKLRSSSVTVALSEKIGHGEGYAAGSLVTVPRIIDAANWSSRNCVRLLPERKRPEATRLAG